MNSQRSDALTLQSAKIVHLLATNAALYLTSVATSIWTAALIDQTVLPLDASTDELRSIAIFSIASLAMRLSNSSAHWHSARSHVSIDKRLLSLPIPLPPLEEQQRIVAVLDEAFEGLARARAHAEANLQNARELFDSYR